ncbi:DEAD/DEAH box helicase [Sediminicola luteus]|uniref:DEAD-box ATP-dependent RNA helicase RhpA n=1 Tax=Sediminicola luteus TaxID=319238 RepID=A0A2A4G7Y2_9FLAO|nr:DEAD/DEAH box helicase [Sediminicola luteus]PCE64090.1 DEAD/DEAH box helicase [Sediminicola luteus]
MKFTSFDLKSQILKALEEKGYVEPTPIQAQAIPLVLKGHDILGVAQTGTGKTAAFSLPILQRMYDMRLGIGPAKISTLIVTPTRELAIQIDENIAAYSKHLPFKHAVIFGGVKQGRQVEQLKRGVHILVATPGRLLDLMDQGYISLDDIKIFVLDEADRMLDMGFIHDIKRLLKVIPKKRQSLFFSATMPDNIKALSNQILHHPKKVEVTPVSSTAETIQQYVYFTNKSLKKQLLLHILESRNIQQVLLFSRTKHGADRIARDLKKKRIDAAAIHGDKAQNQRQRALKAFKEGQLRVLVATDIAARGIDIDKLQYVINFDVPDVPETYIHRIGRSGRAGEAGVAISMSEPEENAHIKKIERLSKKRIDVVNDHPFPQTDKPMTEAEKKEWNKEKQRRKQEFFANRKKKREGGAPNTNKNRNQGRSRGRR